jgi:hypothetical protein
VSLHIAFGTYTAVRERCEVAALRTAEHEPHYEDGAVVPAGEWQPLDPDLAERLRPTEATPDAALVELLRLPPAEPDALAEMARGTFWPDHLPGRSSAEYLGYVMSEPQALTTTGNPATSRRIGLHIDNWDRLPVATRHLSRRRLCINFGPGTRYLLLGDLNVRSIGRALHPGHETRCPHTDDVRRYVAEGKALRCLRIRLHPGDGYVAPTELLPHDGSTEGQPEPSTAAFWLGRWPRRAIGLEM